MESKTIQDIYAANDQFHARLRELLTSLSEEELTARPADEKWSIAQIAEHVSMVENGAIRICNKLLQKAESAGAAAAGDGSAALSPAFVEATASIGRTRLEAPEIVQPTGEVSLADTLARYDDNRARLEEMRPRFESCDTASFKFPHPYFGDMSAAEWLTLIGAHTHRHTRQIERLADKIRNG